MNLQKWTRLSFLGWEVKYKYPPFVGTFSSLECIGETDPEKVKQLLVERDGPRDGPREIVSMSRKWIEPSMQFSEEMADALKRMFPEKIEVRTHQDWKQGRKVNATVETKDA